jgi:hypothetical protein
MARKSRATGKRDGAAGGSQRKRRAAEERTKPVVIRNLSAIDTVPTLRPLLRVIKGDKK